MTTTITNDAIWIIGLLLFTTIMARLILALPADAQFAIFKTLGP